MGATGVCWDNAAAEAFFASLKRELVNRYRWLHRVDARLAIVRWVEGWYNARRLHSTLRYRARSKSNKTGTVTKKPLPHNEAVRQNGATSHVRQGLVEVVRAVAGREMNESDVAAVSLDQPAGG